MSISESLRRRARWMKLQSYFILTIIVATISGGSYLFYFAPQIAGSQLGSVAERVEPIVTEARANIQTFRTDHDALAARVQGISNDQAALASQITSVEAQIKNVQAEASDRLDDIDAQVGRWQAVDFKQTFDMLATVPATSGPNAALPGIVSDLKGKSRRIEEVKDCLVFAKITNADQYRLRCGDGSEQTFLEVVAALTVDLEQPIERLEQLANAPVRHDDSAQAQVIVDAASASLPDEIEFSAAYGAQTLALRKSLDDLAALMATARSSGGSAAVLDVNSSITPETFAALDLRLKTALGDLKNVADTAISKANNWMDYARETTLRVTVIVLIVFLVQILVNLFRYGTRLAAFYEARADALDLADIHGYKPNPAEFHQLVTAFAPDNLDFGKSPRSPVDQAVEITRNLAATARKT